MDRFYSWPLPLRWTSILSLSIRLKQSSIAIPRRLFPRCRFRGRPLDCYVQRQIVHLNADGSIVTYGREEGVPTGALDKIISLPDGSVWLAAAASSYALTEPDGSIPVKLMVSATLGCSSGLISSMPTIRRRR
jgi:hypothetical protein